MAQLYWTGFQVTFHDGVLGWVAIYDFLQPLKPYGQQESLKEKFYLPKINLPFGKGHPKFPGNSKNQIPGVWFPLTVPNNPNGWGICPRVIPTSKGLNEMLGRNPGLEWKLNWVKPFKVIPKPLMEPTWFPKLIKPTPINLNAEFKEANFPFGN